MFRLEFMWIWDAPIYHDPYYIMRMTNAPCIPPDIGYDEQDDQIRFDRYSQSTSHR